MRLSRRHFLHTAGIGTASVWVPGPMKGYTADEMRAMAPDGRVEPGVSKWELDTPALCLDLDNLDENIRRMQAAMTRLGIKSRPHAKTHKSADLARLQIATGSIGICAAKLSEAEALAVPGVDDILMTTINVSPAKIRRAMALRKRWPGFIQAVDAESNARDLSDAAREAGIVADVVVDVAAGTRTGIPAGEPAIALAKLVDQLPSLRFRGLLCYDGGAQHVKGYAARRERALRVMAPAAETCQVLARAGLDTGIFSGGGTGTYDMHHETPGFTDVQVGSYVFMDAQYLAIGNREGEVNTDFLPSLTVVTTVLNAHFEGVATADAGTKALTLNQPDPIVVGETGITYQARSDEFGTIRYDNPSRTYRLGDRLELIVPHCDPVVNLYDQMYGIRNDRVVAVWPVTARGRSQ
jgi:3-hydroxy-D-aspartate aldolase